MNVTESPIYQNFYSAASKDMTRYGTGGQSAEEEFMYKEISAIVAGKLKEQTEPFEVRALAKDIADSMEVLHPELFQQWLESQKVNLIAARIRRVEYDQIRQLRDGAVEDLRSGAVRLLDDAPEPFRPFEATIAVGELHMRVGEMNRTHHEVVADDFGKRGHSLLLLEAFHRAVGRKVGLRRTDEVFTEKEYVLMYQSVVSPTLLAVAE